MSRHSAVVTLLTSDSYLPGCLVTLYSLLDAEKTANTTTTTLPTSTTTPRTFDTLCLVTPSTLSSATLALLRDAFDHVIPVDDIRSQSLNELAILGRPDLLSALTKLHIFRLTQYSKVIYLDADVLVLHPISHLFNECNDRGDNVESSSLSTTTTTTTTTLKNIASGYFAAVPDIGWPDCFNSGVMVFTPKYEWFDLLVHAIAKHGSWDGADQGILNDFFSGNTATNNNNKIKNNSSNNNNNNNPSLPSSPPPPPPPPSWRRLSYTYNVTPSAYYTFVPAFLRYLPDVSIVHFIGSNKPWNRRIRPPRSDESSNDVYNQLIHKWYDVFESRFGTISTTDLALLSNKNNHIISHHHPRHHYHSNNNNLRHQSSQAFEQHYDPAWESLSPTTTAYSPPSPKSLARRFPVDLSQFTYLDTKSLDDYNTILEQDARRREEEEERGKEKEGEGEGDARLLFPAYEKSVVTTSSSVPLTSLISTSFISPSSKDGTDEAAASSSLFSYASSQKSQQPQKDNNSEYFPLQPPPPPQSVKEKEDQGSYFPIATPTAEAAIIIPEYVSVWNDPVSEDIVYHPPSPTSVAASFFSENLPRYVDYLPQLSEKRFSAPTIAPSSSSSPSTTKSKATSTLTSAPAKSVSSIISSTTVRKPSQQQSENDNDENNSRITQQRSPSPPPPPKPPSPERKKFSVFPWEIEGRSLPPPTRVFPGSTTSEEEGQKEEEENDGDSSNGTIKRGTDYNKDYNKNIPPPPQTSSSPPPRPRSPIFPWESSGYNRAAPERVFPDDSVERDAVSLLDSNSEKDGDKEGKNEEGTDQGFQSPSSVLFSSKASTSPRRPIMGQRYVNAWDEISDIGREVKRIDRWLTDQQRVRHDLPIVPKGVVSKPAVIPTPVLSSMTEAHHDVIHPIKKENFHISKEKEKQKTSLSPSLTTQPIKEDVKEEEEEEFLSIKPKRRERRRRSSSTAAHSSTTTSTSATSTNPSGDNTSEQGDDEKEEGDKQFSTSKYRQRRRTLSEDELQRRLQEQKRQNFQQTAYPTMSSDEDDNGDHRLIKKKINDNKDNDDQSPRISPSRVFSAQTDPDRIKRQRLKAFQRLTCSEV